MIVKKWMTSEVHTVNSQDPVSLIWRLFDKYGFHRVPVMAENTLAGIVTDHNLERISKEEKTLTAGDIMTKNPVTTEIQDTVERAALLMYQHNFGGLPVLENGRLAGIITRQDVFKALLEMTGAKWGVPRLTMVIDDRPGSVREVADIIRKYPAKILSMIITKHQMPPDKRELIIRVDSEQLIEIISDLENSMGPVIVHESG